MSVDLYLHSAKGLREEDLACWFSGDVASRYHQPDRGLCRQGRPDGPLPMELWLCEHAKAVGESPRVWLDNDEGRNWREGAVRVMTLVPRDAFPLLDDDLYARVLVAASTLGDVDEEIRPWLEEHRGEPLFWVIW